MNIYGHKRSYDEFSEKYPNLVEIIFSEDDEYFDSKNPKRLAKKNIRAKMKDILKVIFEGIVTYIFTESYHFSKCLSHKECCHSTYEAENNNIDINLTSIKNNILLIAISLYN